MKNFDQTPQGCGLDISSQYLDDLDQACCHHLDSLAGQRMKAIDLGGGQGVHSIRMASRGANVLMVDVADMATIHFNAAVRDGQIEAGRISFLLKDFRDLQKDDIPDQFNLLYSQRALHYLRYKDAKACLSLMFQKMSAGGAVFLSVAGLSSEFGATYPHRARPVARRFSVLSAEMQDKYNTREPLVLYDQHEVENLLIDTGFSEIRFIPSAFGNIRVTALKRS